MDARTLRIVAAVAIVGTAGTLAIATAPAGNQSGYLWPTGLATGVLLWGTRRQAPLLTAVVFLVAAISFIPGPYPLDVALPFAAAIAAQAWVVNWLIHRSSDGDPWLLRTSDVWMYTLACTSGAAVGALGFMGTSLATGHGTAWEIGLAVFTRHLASQLIVVPLFLRLPPQVLRQRHRERVLRWVITLGVAALALVPTTLPSLVFLLLPVLGWSAVRAPLRENQWLVAAVAALAGISTSLGYGPFSNLSQRFADSTELALVPMHAFLIACALVCIPYALAVRQEREALQSAATERSRSDQLLATAQGLVIVGTDDLGRINLFNQGAERVLGYPADEVMGESPEIFHTQEEIARLATVLGTRANFFDVVAAFLARKVPTPMDWEFVRKDGEKRILAFLLSPIYSGDGHVVGFLASADDMTERVRTQQALETALARALAAESDAVTRLAEVDRAKDSFISAVSHELRTPITNLLGYLELLQDGSYGQLTPSQDQALARIALNSSRLLALIDDLLTLARIDEQHFNAGHAAVHLCDLARDAAAGLAPLAQARGLQVDVEVPAEPVLVFGNAHQLERLLANLGDNAAKFTPAGGTVTIRLRQEEGEAVLEVADTGVGIPPEEQERVFNRFFRSSTADVGAVPGTGLGLFIAKSIVASHGARIGLQSAPGEGTTFTVRLPLAAVPATDPVRNTATA